MWSEHCSYKSSGSPNKFRPWRPGCLRPRRDAGIIESATIRAAFTMESNHPPTSRYRGRDRGPESCSTSSQGARPFANSTRSFVGPTSEMRHYRRGSCARLLRQFLGVPRRGRGQLHPLYATFVNATTVGARETRFYSASAGSSTVVYSLQDRPRRNHRATMATRILRDIYEKRPRPGVDPSPKLLIEAPRADGFRRNRTPSDMGAADSPPPRSRWPRTRV